ncbi:MAG: threonine synthase [Erysipelotrichaceae bacterium]|nr:threonine synthase [Erysipelotrichaceae bacterium]MDY5251471.1 threonine synthase [Erysipelotrichaceae bacterium]
MPNLYNTRNIQESISPSLAIIKGLADDQGLYCFKLDESCAFDLSSWYDLNYQQLAVKIIHHFFDDLAEDEIKDCVNQAYDQKFDVQSIVDLKSFDGIPVLETYHGPTCAFKDMALTILPYLMTCAYQKHAISKQIYILCATSGDTGKAALEGFKNVKDTHITVFFPYESVSKIQALQMLTTTGQNTKVIQVKGNFDDCQQIVKNCFANTTLANDPYFQLSSANSINIGRLVPQIIYYVWAYLQLVKQNQIKMNEQINFSVPCGNFGNILAAFIAKKCGLPVDKLIVATNANDVLADFIKTGRYDRQRHFYKTISPSMDILVSSNIERLLFILSGYDDHVVKEYMLQLKEKGYYEVNEMIFKQLQEHFVAYSFDDDQTQTIIKDLYQKTKHCLDPHSAIAYGAAQKYDKNKTVAVATASPYKFAKDVCTAILDLPSTLDEFTYITKLATLTDEKIPSSLVNIMELPLRHDQIIAKEDGISMIIKNFKELKK